MQSENILYSSLIYQSSPNYNYHDTTLNASEASSNKKFTTKKLSKKDKNKKNKVKKGKIAKKRSKKVGSPKRMALKPLLTSTPLKNNTYEIEKIRDTSIDYFELSPLKTTFFPEISYDIFETTPPHDSFLDDFYCKNVIESKTELIYEYKNNYQYIYKVIQNDKLQFLTKRYYPIDDSSIPKEEVDMDEQICEEINNAYMANLEIPCKKLKSAIRSTNGLKKNFNVKFLTFISKEIHF